MLNWFRKKPKETEPAGKMILSGPEKNLFEKALQCYVFVHHVPHNRLKGELAEQFHYLGNVVYSLILNWLKDKKPSLEYMDFLNTRLNELREMEEKEFKGLEILPSEIGDIELNELVRIRFRDDETEKNFRVFYEKKTGICRFDKPE